MSAQTKILIGIAAALVAILCVCGIQHKYLQGVCAERDKYKGNSDALLQEVKTYRVSDSLHAARAQALELTVADLERFRAQDAALIKQLETKNRDLKAVNKTQSQTIITMNAQPRDTVIVVDSVAVPALAVHCGDAWYDFDGILSKNTFTGELRNRDSLLLAETVKYKRFLGFLWKTKQVQDRRMDVLSKNPHTAIIGVEHLIIEK